MVRADADNALVEAARKMLRSDTGEDVKRVVSEPKPPEGRKADEDEKKDEEPTLADVVKLLGAVSDRMDALGKRCDTLETKRGDKDDDGEAEDLAADSASRRMRTALERTDASEMTFGTKPLFAEFQSRVDAVASLYGVGHTRPSRSPANCCATTRPAACGRGGRTEHTKAGHAVTKFYGRPKAWMSQFIPPAKLVKNVRQVGADGTITGTLYQRS